MLGIFATLALTLSGVGLYGLVAYTVGLRTREIGIRMALGANRRKILRQVVGEGMKLAAIGAAIGIVVALPLPRVLESLLQSFSSEWNLGLSVDSGGDSVVALLACYGPHERRLA